MATRGTRSALGDVVSIGAGDVLHEAGAIIRKVFFPIDAVCSMTTSMQDGSEAGTHVRRAWRWRRQSGAGTGAR